MILGLCQKIELIVHTRKNVIFLLCLFLNCFIHFLSGNKITFRELIVKIRKGDKFNILT